MAWWNAKDESRRVPTMTGRPHPAKGTKWDHPSSLRGKPWSEATRKAHVGRHRHWMYVLTGEALRIARARASASQKKRRMSLAARRHLSRVAKANYKKLQAVYNKSKRSAYKRAKASEVAKRYWADPVWKARQISLMRASRKPLSAKTKQRISAKLKGRKKAPRSLEHRRNIAVAHANPITKARCAAAAAMARTRQARPNRAELSLWALLRRYFPRRFRLNLKNGLIIGNKVPDFVCASAKLVVELFGDYWHGPLIVGHSKAEEEKRRIKHFADHGYRTVVVWEHQLTAPERIVSVIGKALA